MASVWIGLNDTYTIDTFGWVTSEPLVYTNWAPGEPNGRGVPACVEFISGRKYSLDYNGRWNDAGCTDGMPAICEFLDGKGIFLLHKVIIFELSARKGNAYKRR